MAAALSRAQAWRNRPRQARDLAGSGLKYLASGPNAAQLHLKYGRAAARICDADVTRRAIGQARDARERRNDDDLLVDPGMRASLPDLFAAGDCVITHHRLLGETYLPLGTTAHKQGRVAGENALGGNRQFAGSLGTQVVKIFDQAAARTGLRDHEAKAAGFELGHRRLRR